MIEQSDDKIAEDVPLNTDNTSILPVVFGFLLLGISLLLLFIDFKAFRVPFTQLNTDFETMTVAMFTPKYFDRAPEAIGQFLGSFMVYYIIFFITTIFTWGAAKLLLFYKREAKLSEAVYIFFGPIGWIIIVDIFYMVTG